MCLSFFFSKRILRIRTQVLLNCITFNTEVAQIVGQSSRLLAALTRHVDRWALQPTPLESCDDSHCMLTGVQIEHDNNALTSIKCGRCLAVFSLQQLEGASAAAAECSLAQTNRTSSPDEPIGAEMETGTAATLRAGAGIYEISNELITQAHEEWYCPLCLRDDFSQALEGTRAPAPPLPFYVDQWGSSAHVPWLLNGRHSKCGTELAGRPDQARLLRAVQVGLPFLRVIL